MRDLVKHLREVEAEAYEHGRASNCNECDILRAERDQLRASLNEATIRIERLGLRCGEAEGHVVALRAEVERLKKAIRFFRSWAHGVGEVADSMWKSANDALGEPRSAHPQRDEEGPK